MCNSPSTIHSHGECQDIALSHCHRMYPSFPSHITSSTSLTHLPFHPGWHENSCPGGCENPNGTWRPSPCNRFWNGCTTGPQPYLFNAASGQGQCVSHSTALCSCSCLRLNIPSRHGTCALIPSCTLFLGCWYVHVFNSVHFTLCRYHCSSASMGVCTCLWCRGTHRALTEADHCARRPKNTGIGHRHWTTTGTTQPTRPDTPRGG